ncbi:MAG: SOS response-associated peptidase [Nitrospirales bacterium]|nr:SOS response-associated peptidase [Nitrospirales bacterium]MBA3964503.1 SOS response-associated peptidase [Nitrospirales bacterium]
MCGRFTRKENFQNLAEQLGLKVLPPFNPRYNIAPSQLVACVRTNLESRQRECTELKWGLVPSWAKDPGIGNKLINARGETVAEKPAFRKAFKHQRCLVLADGFYEWKREGNTKQPYYIRFKDHRVFAFAGLWERWEQPEAKPLESCTLITTGPNAVMEPIHHRMPVILSFKDYADWLDPSFQFVERINAMLRPYPSEEMEAYPVSQLVNNPRNDQPECVIPMQ